MVCAFPVMLKNASTVPSSSNFIGVFKSNFQLVLSNLSLPEDPDDDEQTLNTAYDFFLI